MATKPMSRTATDVDALARATIRRWVGSWKQSDLLEEARDALHWLPALNRRRAYADLTDLPTWAAYYEIENAAAHAVADHANELLRTMPDVLTCNWPSKREWRVIVRSGRGWERIGQLFRSAQSVTQRWPDAAILTGER